MSEQEQEPTGTDIAVRDQTRQEVAHPFDGASEEITRFLADLSVAFEIASRLVTTSFVPQSYQNRPQEAAAAIVAGQGVGLGPMEALRSIDIIQGTPAMRAITLRALVVSRGHEMWLEESSPTHAIVAGRRAGSDQIQRSVWDMARAQAMGLVTKDNWRKQPGAMLIARATSECARLVAPDALLGIPYSTEELQDLDARPVSEGAAVRPARQIQTVASRMRAAEASKAEPAPITPPDAESASGGPVEPESTTPAGGFPCTNCGEPTATEDGGICVPCETDIEAAMTAEQEQES